MSGHRLTGRCPCIGAIEKYLKNHVSAAGAPSAGARVNNTVIVMTQTT